MPATDIIHEQLEQIHYQPPRQFHVVLHNDDYTPMDFVVELLMQLFRLPSTQAIDTMLQIHHQGSAICGTYCKEIAETKVDQVKRRAHQQGYPLLASLQPE